VEKRELGHSGLEVSVLGLGCWPLGGGPGWGDQDESVSIATIHAALDHGINFLDTAEGYNSGRSEEVVGKAMVDRRDKALITTKVSPSNAEPATLRAHCEASLKRLQTDYIDLYQVHWPITDYSIEDAFATLRDLQDEGKIRAIGVSNHGVEQLGEVLATGTSIASNQMCYSLLTRAIENGVMPLCQESNISIIAYMALMQGLLAGIYKSPDEVPPFRTRTRHFSGKRPGSRHGEEGAEVETFVALAGIRRIAKDLGLPMAQVALAWVASRPGVGCVLVGSRKPEQLARNIAAASIELPPEALKELDAVTNTLRIKLGTNPDVFQGAGDGRTR